MSENRLFVVDEVLACCFYFSLSLPSEFSSRTGIVCVSKQKGKQKKAQKCLHMSEYGNASMCTALKRGF